ncbi:ferredoxin-NADP reductase [Jatrophihabitans sp. GAS493]|uniref:FAD-binding oxidoreductase n=1 Tax=Jatrophihabitans sp. GAS493 TaxID=1907575 RepID=UPI000BBFB6C6|nr:FAD-binding oxidoreductase [Jatrophihabitans sp. GAS493]SOD74496.1 ferredoxin-NADP reductase [Jatrophihabitans sp. GAS493]
MTESFTPRAPVGGWRNATVREVSHPTQRSVMLRLEVPDRVDHLPGQHYVIRLRADDGYVAQRSYSVSSAPSDPLLEFFVERLEDGEVSSFLADVVEVGDSLEIRGPIGGWFVWDAESDALALGGGSGVAPLIAMLRHAIHLGRADRLRLAVSSRSFATLPYAEELVAAGALIAITREAYGDRAAGRLTAAEVAALAKAELSSEASSDGPERDVFVCGSTPFAEAASSLLVELGVPSRQIRIERFGPSGS